MQIPGGFGSLTLAFGVKIDSLDRWYNSLFLTDGYDKGEPHWRIPHWRILDDGRIQFAIRNLNGDIDKLVILATALASDEVKEIYEHGKL